MVLVDTHTHLYLPHFSDDIEQVIENASRNHVKKMLLPNIDDESYSKMMDLHRRFPGQCLPMTGLHPTSVDADYLDKLSWLELKFHTENFIAIGETGLDAHWDTAFMKEQEDSFIIHLEWAKKYDLPVVIHSRKTMDKIIDILGARKGAGLRGVFHAFSGSAEQAARIVDLGFKLGIGGVVTYKNTGLVQVVKSLALEYLVLETDSPYLTPFPRRGQRNESANLLLIAEKIAVIKNIPVVDVARATTRNASGLFNLNLE